MAEDSGGAGVDGYDPYAINWNDVGNAVGGAWNGLVNLWNQDTWPWEQAPAGSNAPVGPSSPADLARGNDANAARYMGDMNSYLTDGGFDHMTGYQYQSPPHGGSPTKTGSGSSYNGMDFSSLGAGGGRGGGGGGISAYQQALLDLERQKEADARAQAQARIDFDKQQAEMKKQYDESQAIDTFDKNFRDYQSKHYYGAMYGPGYFAPNGAAQAYKAPEPYYVEQYYKDHPEAGADPFSQNPAYAGYGGSHFFNPQHNGMAAAPIGSQGQATGATNPLPYGPELTGESGFGGTITQDGTPVALSAWQRSHLDPTSLEHYNSYLGDIAGADPADFKSYTQQESGELSSLKAPTSFSYSQ